MAAIIDPNFRNQNAAPSNRNRTGLDVTADITHEALMIVLSGDVHYGMNKRALFSSNGRPLHVIQLVSSSPKNLPSGGVGYGIICLARTSPGS